ncbi:MAG TPA: TonB family protein [Chryseolinea sp.]|nr:TonB family protein [Chryseolinea sp.]
MKQKIKIMEQRPQLSDEEIRSYMDFDRLMADKKLVASKPRYRYLKWVAPAIALTGVVAWLIFNYPAEKVEQPKNVTIEDAQNVPAKPSDPVPSNEQVATSPQKEEPKVVKKSAVESLSANQQEKLPQATEKKLAEDIYVQAEPLNGYSDLYAYFNSNLVYPTEALKDSIQGVETVSFVVNTEGKPEKIAIKQSLGESFEKEARRLIENMPLWKPATLNGKPVPSQMSIPLTFQIQKVNVNR